MMEPSHLHFLPICRCMFMYCIVQFQEISILPLSPKKGLQFPRGGRGSGDQKKMFKTGILRGVGGDFFEKKSLLYFFWNYTF